MNLYYLKRNMRVLMNGLINATRYAGVCALVGAVMLGFAVSTLAEDKLETVPEAQISGRIVGGQAVSAPTKFPWMTSLRVTISGEIFQCGGTLIDPDWVLTAAHCVQSGTVVASGVDAVVGDFNRNLFSFTEARVSAVQIIVHESYDEDTNANDIALLQLERSINNITPLKLGQIIISTSNTQVGESLSIIGWGETRKREVDDGLDNMSSPQLIEATLPLIKNQLCDDAYISPVTAKQLCAGFYDVGEVDTCYGDSGGPLLYQENSEWLQLGIVSFGNGCAQPQRPGVYTSVNSYIQWIEGKIAKLIPSVAPGTSQIGLQNTATKARVNVVAGNGLKNGTPAASFSSGGGGGAIPIAWMLLLGVVLAFSRFLGWRETSTKNT